MRVVSLTVIVFLVSVSIAAQASGDVDQRSDIHRIAEAIVSDGRFVFEHLDENAVWRFPGRKELRGRREIMQFAGEVGGLLEHVGERVTTNVVVQGDQIVREFYLKGRVTKKGDPYNNHYCLIYKVADGKIVAVTEYADTALAERVLPELDFWN